MGNLLGEPFKDYVDTQIGVRQKAHGRSTRSLSDLQYLNSKNAWIKLASGTSFDATKITSLTNGNPLLTGVTDGFDLAKKNILFNGLSTSSGGSRAGIGTNGAYGVGGTSQYGYSPMPGIMDADIKDLNRGSIKKATLNIVAHNRNQFEVIDALYLRLGFSVMLEWGVDKYLDNSSTLQNMGNTLIETDFFTWNDKTYSTVLPAIEAMREKYAGNYDGVFGIVSNFSWTFEDDGSYKIKVEIISQGDVIESLKANLPKKYDPANPTNVYGAIAGSVAARLAATNVADFFALYPGLEAIVDQWLDAQRIGVIIGKLYYHTTLSDENGAFGPPSPAFRLGNSTLNMVFPILKDLFFNNYYNSSTPNPLHTPQNRLQAESITLQFKDILKNAVEDLRITKNNEALLSNKFTSKDSSGGNSPSTTAIIVGGVLSNDFYNDIGNNLYPGSTIYESHFRGVLDDESTWIGSPTNSIPSNKVIAQSKLAWNIDPTNLKDKIYKSFLSANLAGGPLDPQFAGAGPSPTPLPAAQQARLDAEKTIEVKKDKNKIFTYFYKIRKIWTSTHANFNNDWNYAFGKINYTPNPTPKPLGGIWNPVTTTANADTDKWNTGVGFPQYPIAAPNNGADFVRMFFTPIERQFYIRFGIFLEYLEKYIIPKMTDSTNEPLLKIDYDPNTNLCYVIDNMISTDINRVLIKNSNFYRRTTTDYVKCFSGLRQFLYTTTPSNLHYGNIMNIYINFERIQELFEDVDTNNQVSVFSILKNLSNDINECLGNVNNIEPIIDKETNTVKFIDQTPIPGIDTIRTSLGITFKPLSSLTALEIFGFNKSKSNFVRKAGITTEISKKYATMITIGATSNGSVPGIEATAFSRWNKGIKDRFKNEIVDSEADPSATIEEQNKGVIENYSQFTEASLFKFGLDGQTPTEYNISDDVISKNTDLVGDFYTYQQAILASTTTSGIEDSNGFIPFNLKLTMDGLSGIKIYNLVVVNTSFLPKNYGETLSFIITGVNHKLSNDEWVTNLDTIATLK